MRRDVPTSPCAERRAKLKGVEEPTPPQGPTPPTPYRDGKALSEIIPPDTRRQKTIAVVLASMIAGVCLWQLGGWALVMIANRDPIPPEPPTLGYIAGRIRPSVLHGPGSSTMTMPPVTRSVVHVWLQGCADCMPAFEAMRELESSGGLGVRVPIINVAYGEAETTWARRYGVDHNLVFDPGGANVVKPLGIGTFTTLVIDGDGTILHRDRPDRAGYRDRVRAAVGNANLEPEPTVDPNDPLAPARAPFDAAAVQRVVAAHQAGVRRTCWERSRNQGPQSANVTLKLTIGPEGHVVSSSSSGDDPAIAKCVEDQAKTWLFPLPESTVSVNIPFKFVRE